MSFSAPSSSKMMTRNGKKEEANPVPFEEMFYDRGTQRAALEFLQEKMKDVTKKDRMELRDSPKKSCRNVNGQRKAKKLKVQIKMYGDTGDNDKPVDVNGKGSQEEKPTAGKEERYVQDLLKRYDAGRTNALPKPIPSCPDSLSQSDLDDMDDDKLDEEVRAALEDTEESTSDFLKYSVPQYELKEKLYQMHYEAIRKLTMKDIVELLNEVLPELNQIRNGEITCERHKIFQTTGLSKQKLRDMTVFEPFTSAQDYRIMTIIQDNVFEDQDCTGNNGEILHYISTVMVQEAMVRIFAKANNIDIKLAENELRFKAGYDGKLSPDVIKTIPIAAEQGDQ